MSYVNLHTYRRSIIQTLEYAASMMYFHAVMDVTNIEDTFVHDISTVCKMYYRQ